MTWLEQVLEKQDVNVIIETINKSLIKHAKCVT